MAYRTTKGMKGGGSNSVTTYRFVHLLVHDSLAFGFYGVGNLMLVRRYLCYTSLRATSEGSPIQFIQFPEYPKINEFKITPLLNQ
jgi:hypothetical protein